MKKLILTSKSDFTEIRRLGGVYVDKTKDIYDCIGADTYYFLSRPRRFGKSLLCSTLKAMFSGNRELFKGLWVESYFSDEIDALAHKEKISRQYHFCTTLAMPL